MYILGNKIYFKSIPEMFSKEKTIIKPNTERFLCPVEEDEFKAAGKITHIHIENTETGESFIRELTDITPFKFSDVCNTQYIFSWKHVED
jgi:hypothetical protein